MPLATKFCTSPRQNFCLKKWSLIPEFFKLRLLFTLFPLARKTLQVAVSRYFAYIARLRPSLRSSLTECPFLAQTGVTKSGNKRKSAKKRSEKLRFRSTISLYSPKAQFILSCSQHFSFFSILVGHEIPI